MTPWQTHTTLVDIVGHATLTAHKPAARGSGPELHRARVHAARSVSQLPCRTPAAREARCVGDSVQRPRTTQHAPAPTTDHAGTACQTAELVAIGEVGHITLRASKTRIAAARQAWLAPNLRM